VNARIFLIALASCLVIAAGAKGWLVPFQLLEPTGWADLP
jgi:hypothetical protein